MKILTASQIPTNIVDTPLDDPVKLYEICQELKLTCQINYGKGLSAVQVGIPWKLFVVAEIPKFLQVNLGSFGYFVNCEYKSAGKGHKYKVESIEGCLSILSKSGKFKQFRVMRYPKIRVRGLRLVGLELIKFDEILDIPNDSVVFQHEIDHHNNILINQIGKEIGKFS